MCDFLLKYFTKIKTKYGFANIDTLFPQVLDGTLAALQEAGAKLEEKRTEEANGRTALAETYARIRELESKIAVGLAVKSDEVIKEQQLVSVYHPSCIENV